MACIIGPDNFCPPGSDRIRPLYTVRDNTALFQVLTHRMTAFPEQVTGTGLKPVQLASLDDRQLAARRTEPAPWRIWFSGSYGNLENDHVATDHSGDLYTGIVGIDRKLGKANTLGLSVSWDRMNLDTGFNFGNYESESLTIATYGSHQFGDWLELNVMLAYSNIEIDQSRPNALFTATIVSTADSRRWLGQVSATATEVFRSWYASGKLGVVYSDEKINGFNESDGSVVPERDIDLGQAHLEGRVGILFSGGAATLGATYVYDFDPLDFSVGFGQPTPDDDRDGLMLSGSLTLFHAPGVTSNFALSHEFARNYVNNTFLTISLVARF